MVSSATIKRFAEQIDALEAKLKAKRGHKVVFCTRQLGETSDLAWARHLADHPDDEDADVVISTFYDDADHQAYEQARELAARKTESLRVIRNGREN